MAITHFSKMHGLGNDFVVINALHEPFSWTSAEILRLADRHTGIGFDQLLVIEPPPDKHSDFAYRIFNADGSEVEHCGNGARCFGKYIRDHGLAPNKDCYRVAVKRGHITIAFAGMDTHDRDLYRVDMGEPDFTPFTTAQHSCLHQIIDGQQFGIVSMGNPHAVSSWPSLDDAPVAQIGAALQHHPLFPEQVNVGFMHIHDRHRIDLRVFERGVGETQACGTGACAAVAVGIARGELAHEVQVVMQRGTLLIQWQGTGYPLTMTGPAETIYHGQLANKQSKKIIKKL